ncbi:C2 domain-containing protein [Zychaea mexicana]|uniref:C2 domain-containing protein n=1 Tax=Zychaea mexicana TaxID=64656 RepID=UPI0022FE5797|nr:C2 domain-containing protein [Zychaea mexicana]KAI9490456.1 C2 domain-containing protein [Zychaea mexicana]
MLGEGVLPVTIVSANNLLDVENMGKNDPYVRITTDINNDDSWQVTEVQEDAGENASWGQTFEIALGGESTDLFVEVMDKEKGVDTIIGFCTIPLATVVGGADGLYEIYTIKGEPAGVIHLVFNNAEGEATPGRSYINDEHLERCKSLHHKALAGDIGTAAVGAGLAIGAGLIGKKLFEEYKAKMAAEEA